MSDQKPKVRFIRTRLEKLRLVNFVSFDDYTVSFVDADGVVRSMTGLHGPNGTGKSTILNAVAMLFNNFTGYDEQRFSVASKKYVRNVINPDVAGEGNLGQDGQVAEGFKAVGAASKWMVEGNLVTEDGEEYAVRVSNDKDDYVWQSPPEGQAGGAKIRCAKLDHPVGVRITLGMQCYLASYDKELNQFQLRKDRWPIFKKLFEAVTGYPVDRKDANLDEETIKGGGNQRLALLDQYVLAISIKKPSETISERQCSDGEKKTIKNFTTILNKDIIPSLILIDNVEMHVEIDRHVKLVRCIEECFPDSQVLFTTHSPAVINEYDIDRLVCLVNKKLPQGDLWRQRFARAVRGMLVMAQDETLISECHVLLGDIWSEAVTDENSVRLRILDLTKKVAASVEAKFGQQG